LIDSIISADNLVMLLLDFGWLDWNVDRWMLLAWMMHGWTTGSID